MNKLLKQLPLCIVTGAMVLSGCAVIAEPPPGTGRDRHERHDDDRDNRRGRGGDDRRVDRDDDRRGGRRDDDRRGSVQIQIGGYFGERQRSDVYAYYGQPPRAHCPPGLAKKNNDC